MKKNVVFDHPVLKLFQELSRIPRESGNEKAVSAWIRAWAEERDLEVSQDGIWNLIIRKPASAGYESHPPLMMQAHIDMVCEKDRDSDHDFSKDPIELALDGDWIVSGCGTSLGADDGIGAAAALALLEDDTLKHPPLEVVFTVQEETTFAGAQTVDISSCRAMRMINLDHADETEIIAGSCGGTGVNFTMPLDLEEELPPGHKAYRIRLTGLKGGHSGEDIHRGRGNAICLLLRLLEEPQLRTVSIHGGTNRLAIPREAEAVILVPEEVSVTEYAARMAGMFRRELSGTASNLAIEVTEAEAGRPLTRNAFDRLTAVIRLYPNGIHQMNGQFEGLVESSDNIGILAVQDGQLKLVSEVRGAYQSTVDDIVRSIKVLANLIGAETECFNGYLPWEFEEKSELRSIAMDTYEELYGKRMKPIALHAGLECGFFAEKKPGIDLISIGPNCQYFHSPQERVSVTSVERFYKFLKAILQKC